LEVSAGSLHCQKPQQKCARLLEDKHGIVKKKRDLSNGNTNRQVGVSTDKFYLDVTVKQDTLLDDLETTEEREVWFAEHQQNIQKRFTEAKDIIFFFTAIPGFFSNLQHTENHFEWLTGKNIAASIEKDLPCWFKIVN
jgi:hypothetical protein